MILYIVRSYCRCASSFRSQIIYGDLVETSEPIPGIIRKAYRNLSIVPVTAALYLKICYMDYSRREQYSCQHEKRMFLDVFLFNVRDLSKN